MKSNVLTVIMKFQHPADEQQQSRGSVISFTCFVCFNEWVYNNGKITTDGGLTAQGETHKGGYNLSFNKKCSDSSGDCDVKSMAQ